jgi:TusA-related sulfurtransferase/uncharacterized OsmC-like protein
MALIHRYDAGDLGCGDGLPQEFRRQINSIPAGDDLELTTRDPSAKEDLPALARLLGHEVISVKTGDKGTTTVIVRRNPASSESAKKEEKLNGMEIEEVRKYASLARQNPEKYAAQRKLGAEWVGGTRAKVYSGDKEIFIGGEEDFGAMSVSLASLLACEIDLLATHATARGIEIEKLSIEGTGDYNLAKYLNGGIGPDPGFQRIEFTVRIKSTNATREQLEDLVGLCETSSPVGSTYSRSVPISMKFRLD